MQKIKPYYQINTFYTCTGYDNMNVCNQIIIRHIFDFEPINEMDNYIYLIKIVGDKRTLICKYNY